MDFANLPLFHLMKAKLNYTSARQSVLAQNIANADTPDYRARDVAAPDFKKMVMDVSGALPLAAPRPGHIAGGPGGAPYKIIDRPSTYEQSPMGNNVSIEEEMMQLSKNQGQYQRTLHLYRKTVMMFKTALGAPGGNG